ncbi:hypothetical protein GCM10010522_22740 [Kribbella solani]
MEYAAAAQLPRGCHLFVCQCITAVQEEFNWLGVAMGCQQFPVRAVLNYNLVGHNREDTRLRGGLAWSDEMVLEWHHQRTWVRDGALGWEREEIDWVRRNRDLIAAPLGRQMRLGLLGR